MGKSFSKCVCKYVYKHSGQAIQSYNINIVEYYGSIHFSEILLCFLRSGFVIFLITLKNPES